MTAIPVMATPPLGINLVPMGSPFVQHAMHSYLATNPDGSVAGFTVQDLMAGEPLALDGHVMAHMASSLGKPLFYPTVVTPNETRQRRVRRTFKELSRELECPQEGCARRYASRSSLATHIRLKHSPEAKQQQEEAKLQRKKSQDKPSTPRPVRPRTLSCAPIDILRRQTVGSFPVVLAPHPHMPRAGWSPIASPARLHSPSLELTSTCSSPLGSYSSDFLPRTDSMAQFSSPFSTPSTRRGSVASFPNSASQSPDMSHDRQNSIGSAQSFGSHHLAQPLQAVSLDEILLTNLHDLDLHMMDLPSSGVLPVVPTPTTVLGSNGVRVFEQSSSALQQSDSSSDEMEDMRMFLSEASKSLEDGQL